jgi:hypothetical protein
LATKRLCSWDKDRIARKPKKLRRILANPKFYCRTCARAASAAEYLCKPEPLK